MKILKLLNSKYLTVLLIIFLLGFNAIAEDEPIDIWNIDKNKTEDALPDSLKNNEELTTEQVTQSSIYDMQSEKQLDTVQMDSSLLNLSLDKNQGIVKVDTFFLVFL